jgi:ketosteroid isomerase-like protein
MAKYQISDDNEDTEDLDPLGTTAPDEAQKDEMIKQYLAGQYAPPSGAPAPINVASAQSNPYAALMNTADIEAAQKESARASEIADFGQAIANTFNPRGAAGAADFFQGMRQSGQEPVKAALQNRQLAGQNLAFAQQQSKIAAAAKLDDPTSSESSAARIALKNIAPKLVTDLGDERFNALSANAIKNHMMDPAALKLSAETQLAKVREAAAGRRAATALASAERGEREKTKLDEALDKKFERFHDHMKGSTRDVIGNEKRRLNTAMHAKGIAHGDPSKLTPMQIHELGGALASQVAQGSPAESVIKSMTPETAKQDMAKFLGYFFSRPVEADTPEYVNLLKQMIDRQIKISEENIQREMAPLMVVYKDLYQQRPDQFKEYLAEAGVTLNDKGKFVAYEARGAHETEPETGEKPAAGTAYAGEATKSTPSDDKAMAWLNDPANAGDPHYNSVKTALQRKGLLK